ncbi:SH3 domain-binding glutamic acid-rich protein homolog isoform X2 [Palaemon carinicauda]|uniref:SH3 domain-binding glutamic acid-rich protein homolog isoform X2 n=1 Tax=Palaemon carinicauda TaxID=392227 RepID=UPI0035B57A98
MILESKNIPFVTIDITDPGQEDSKDYMNENAKPKGNNKIPMTPQIFNDADYCGDFDDMDMANECDTLGDFLKLTDEQKKDIKIGITSLVPDDEKSKHQDSQPLTNGVSTSREVNEVPPVSVITPAETAIEDKENTRDLPDEVETKDVDGEVETKPEEVNEDDVTKDHVETDAPEEKGVEEEGEVEEEEEVKEEGKEEDNKGVHEPSA